MSISSPGHCAVRGLLVSLVLLGSPAMALSPSEVFEKAAPSVWAVRALDAQERPMSYGSAVVIGPGQLVTRCHVLARAKAIQIRQENLLYEARLEHADVERDLCLLGAQKFNAPAVPVARLADLKVGQRVYAVGNPERVASTLSEGLLSSLRDEDGKPLLQTTAPLSAGMSGAGLFDERGFLVGIARVAPASPGKVQGLHAGVPAAWIAEVPDRAKQHLAARNAPVGAAPAGAVAPPVPGMPAPGTTWKYTFQDAQYSGPTRSFAIRVDSVTAQEVRESFLPEGGEARPSTVQADQIRFSSHRLTSDYAVIELAPYLFSGPKRGAVGHGSPAGYPGKDAYRVEALRIREEDVSVPAGTFKATRVDVGGSLLDGSAITSHTTINPTLIARFQYTAWYAPEVNRYVMIRHQTWNPRGLQLSDERTRLVEHRSAQ